VNRSNSIGCAKRTGKRQLTSSSNPNVPRLLPMPPEADVEICALDDSGMILSFILSKNDMMSESIEKSAFGC
jgi:hypothetical protein